jgi:hypothetical protein
MIPVFERAMTFHALNRPAIVIGKLYPYIHIYVHVYICIRVHFAGLLDVQNILSEKNGISRQTESHSFGDHVISGSVSVTPSSEIESPIVLCSVSLWLV